MEDVEKEERNGRYFLRSLFHTVVPAVVKGIHLRRAESILDIGLLDPRSLKRRADEDDLHPGSAKSSRPRRAGGETCFLSAGRGEREITRMSARARHGRVNGLTSKYKLD